ncbi:uncharacterized protein LOC110956029 [Acanthochromis polyacanthus]|uniref:uncharacterized protein LOC110956029 n=1 Tax=Acanthochromis polyacanthus TaxID=80966 RepID=UPI0022345F40|nr:uncharacterized protein LOC110956029 [Acanthochromis polyacanthus]
MMKVSGRILIRCAALTLVLTSGSAIQILDSIDDLKRINFGRSVPTHSLVLLHWFANTVTIDGYNGISLNFDPDSGDYGSHYYGNYEGLLPLGNNRYYTIGNIYQERGLQLPHHVVNPRPEYAGRNRARIIVRVRHQGRQGLQIIDEVYITQHYEMSDNQGTDYDPHQTFLITPNLLRQIRQFSMNGDQHLLMSLRNRFGSNVDDSQLRLIRNTWGSLACLGLLLRIVVQSGTSDRNNNLCNDCVLFMLLLLFIAFFILFGNANKQHA